MSLYVIEKPPDPWTQSLLRHWYYYNLRSNFEIRDSAAYDGEWHAVITLKHEVVEWEGYGVPAFEGDLERIEWERQHKV